MSGNLLVRFDEGRVGRTARCRPLSYSTARLFFLFFQSIDDTENAVLGQRRVEIDRRSKSLVSQPQVGQKLLSVNRRENLDRFDLDDHPIRNNQVGPEPDVDPNRPIDHRDGLLAHRSESALSQFICQHGMINRFQ